MGVMAIFKSTEEKFVAGGQAAPDQITLISTGAVFEGDLSATGDLRVSGKLKGRAVVDGRIVLAPDGLVDGEVAAENGDVAGEIRGNVTVAGRLVLKSTARVIGDVRARRLVMEEGAVLDGTCRMTDTNAEIRPRPVLGNPVPGDGA
jgi:cytoskeletal protein CcmA (bactofilin family)